MAQMQRRVKVLVASGALFAALAAFVLAYFAPQDLFIDTSVDEALPSASVAASVGAGAAASAPGSGAPRVLRRGSFRSGEHHTTGRASLLRLADGRTFVRLEDLDTSNGPAVRIWLSAAPASSSDGVVEHSAHLDIGGLKANHGNQNYAVPTGSDVAQYRSVVVWCRRFDVVFGSAPLHTPTS